MSEKRLFFYMIIEGLPVCLHRLNDAGRQPIHMWANTFP